MAAMKLSEAIRLGAMLKPQAFGVTKELDGSTCAMGAAADAIGLDADLLVSASWLSWIEHFPTLAWVLGRPCPRCGAKFSATSNPIAHLNDSHKWTREAIADWVETLERAEGAVVGSHEDQPLSETSASAQSEAPKEFSPVTMVKA